MNKANIRNLIPIVVPNSKYYTYSLWTKIYVGFMLIFSILGFLAHYYKAIAILNVVYKHFAGNV